MSRTVPNMKMHIVVERPVGLQSNGRIICNSNGRLPIRYEWESAEGNVVNVVSDGGEAVDLAAGRYTVYAEDASGAVADEVVDVQAMDANYTVIEGYKVTPASTSFSRDGVVEVVGQNISQRTFLWTNGAITRGGVLKDVSCGIYSAFPNFEPGAPQVVIVTSGPAEVDVKLNGRW